MFRDQGWEFNYSKLIFFNWKIILDHFLKINYNKKCTL